MGLCDLCGQKAGFFSSRHRACNESHERAAAEVRRLVVSSAFSPRNLMDVEAEARKAGEGGRLRMPRDVLLEAWDAAIDELDPENSPAGLGDRVQQFSKAFGISQEELERRASFRRLRLITTYQHIRDSGDLSFFSVTDDMPFQLLKGDSLVWATNNVGYHEVRAHREYVGGSHGVSFRIAKGVSYRVGSHRGHTVSTDRVTRIGQGPLALGHYALYFYSPAKSVRVSYNKLATVVQHADGIEIQRDAATAKPQYFTMSDAWFAYSMLRFLSARASR